MVDLVEKSLVRKNEAFFWKGSTNLKFLKTFTYMFEILHIS